MWRNREGVSVPRADGSVRRFRGRILLAQQFRDLGRHLGVEPGGIGEVRALVGLLLVVLGLDGLGHRRRLVRGASLSTVLSLADLDIDVLSFAVLGVGELDAESSQRTDCVLGIGRSDGGQPLDRLRGLALVGQQVGVGRRKAKPPGVRGVQRRGIEAGPRNALGEGRLEHQTSRCRFSQIAPCAGLDEAQLGGLLRLRGGGERLGDQAQGNLGATEGALAVGQHGTVTLVATHSPIGAQLPGSLGIVPGGVGGHADRLPDSRHPRRPIARSPRMGKCGGRVVVDERPRGDEVPRYAVHIPRVETTQRRPNSLIEIPDVDPLGDLGTRRQRWTAVLTRGIGPPAVGSSVLPGRTVALLGTRGPVALWACRTVALGTAVLPPRAVTLLRASGPVPLGTPVLPARAVTLLRASGPVALLRTRGPVPRRTPVLPARTVPLLRPSGPIPLGTPVLPARTVALLRTRGPVPLRTAVLPARTITLRTCGPLTLRTCRTVTLRTPLAFRSSGARRTRPRGTGPRSARPT
ncbi:MAG: hypothetical protein QOJ68_167 [Blastococcus sp.]|nr:hypothetical protein [Blastococcus sp.]